MSGNNSNNNYLVVSDVPAIQSKRLVVSKVPDIEINRIKAEIAKTKAKQARDTAIQAKDDAVDAKNDAENHAQATGPFVDTSDVSFDKGAKGFSQDANDFREKAKQWAENPIGEEVTPGKFSAKHWAQSDVVEKVFYVAEDGNDNNDGKTLKTPTRSVKKAVEYATNYINANTTNPPTGPPPRVSIHIKSGYYTEEAPITVPTNTSIIGDDLRTVVVRPSAATKTQNLFLLNNSCYIWGLRFEGCEIDNLENPTSGFFIAFAPGAFIITSPYVQNCTAVHTPFNAFYAPLDPINENPLIGNGPGGMLVDDTVLDPYSPLKSMIVDAFTQVAFNGIGICVRNRGYAQLVSFFTNFSRIGVYCIDGGHASLLNSNTTFGDFGLRSVGKRYLVNADMSPVTSPGVYAAEADAINQNSFMIVEQMMVALIAQNTVGDYSDPSSPSAISTRRDAGLLVDAIADDLRTPNPSRVAQFVQGLFTGKDTTGGSRTTTSGAVAVFPLSITSDFLLSFDLLAQEINSVIAPSLATTKVQQLIDVVKETLESVIIRNEDQYVTEFGSLITSTAHDFSYAGAGVNFLGLPPNQGGIGQTNFETRVVEDNGGRVFHTSGDESGDFFAGNDFIIRQDTGTIDGRTFAKSLFSLVTPFSLALES